MNTTIDLPKMFAEYQDPINHFEGKKIILFLVTDWVDTGMLLASKLYHGMSNKASALLELGGGRILTNPECINTVMPQRFFMTTFGKVDIGLPSLPDDCLFVFPENYLVPKQEREFIDRVVKAPGGKRIVVISKSIIIPTDFFSNQCFVVTEEGFNTADELDSECFGSDGSETPAAARARQVREAHLNSRRDAVPGQTQTCSKGEKS